MSVSSGESRAEGATSAVSVGDAGEDHGSNQGDRSGESAQEVREEKKGVGKDEGGAEMGGVKVGMSTAEVLQQKEIERLRNHTRLLERWVVGSGRIRSGRVGSCTWG